MPNEETQNWGELGAADCRHEGAFVSSEEAHRRAKRRMTAGMTDTAEYWLGYAYQAKAIEEERESNA